MAEETPRGVPGPGTTRPAGTDGADTRRGRATGATAATATGERDQRLARWLLRSMLADPGHLPEILASFASRRLGGRAARTVARVRAGHPDADPDELRALVIGRGRRVVVTEGAFVGGPFMLLIPFAFCAALLAQLRMALEIAAVAGRDAASPDRAAELLVIQGAHPDVPAARAALDAMAARTDAAGARSADRRGSRTAALWTTVRRMAYLLGLLGPSGKPTRTPVRVARWALVIAVVVVGFVAPLVWLPYLAFSYHRSTGELAERTVDFYRSGATGGTWAAPEAAGDLHAAASDPGMIAAVVRASASLLLPLGALALVVVADLRDSRWPVLAVSVTGLSVAVGAVWYLRRRRRPGR
ncbi:hypothetical protein [Streptomyces sp. NRRL S-87]|uniref:hypothetical protein n=1 Tax=Streptomyces sp. NRRL S-87 TaxID=1463920 RepID=UPI00068DDD81|nr:hypothetical protein [Streptomyces sp. NRRL S-87]